MPIPAAPCAPSTSSYGSFTKRICRAQVHSIEIDASSSTDSSSLEGRRILCDVVFFMWCGACTPPAQQTTKRERSANEVTNERTMAEARSRSRSSKYLEKTSRFRENRKSAKVETLQFCMGLFHVITLTTALLQLGNAYRNPGIRGSFVGCFL